MSHLLLVRLRTLPRPVVPVLALGLALVGILATPVVAIPALGLLLALLAFLATFSWPRVDRRGRLLRMIALGVLAGLIVSRAYELLA